MKTKQIIGLMAISVLVVACHQSAPESKDVASQPENKPTLTAEEQQAQAKADRTRQNIIQQGVALNKATTCTEIESIMFGLVRWTRETHPEGIKILIDYLKKNEALLPATAPESGALRSIEMTIPARATPEGRLELTVQCLMESKSAEAHQAVRDFIARFSEKYGDSEYGKSMSRTFELAQAEPERTRKLIIKEGVNLNNATWGSGIGSTMMAFIGNSGPESISIMVDYLKKHEALLPTMAPSSSNLENIKRTIRNGDTPESRLVLTVRSLMESKSLEAHQEARDFIARFNEKYGDSEYGKFMNQELKQAREDGVGRRQQDDIMVKYYRREIDAKQMREEIDKIDITKED